MGPLKLTAAQRSLAEAIGLAQRGDFDSTPNCDTALTMMAAELKALRKKVTILYVGTALGAFFILAQGSSSGLAVELFGLKVPVSMLSKQALAVFLGGAFGYYAAALASLAMLYGAIASILSRTAPEGWLYLLARYDADMLWMDLLFPRRLGYPTPIGERRIALIVHASNSAVVGSHVALVLGAVVAAANAAFTSGSYFGILLAVLALVAVAGAIVGALSAFFLRFTYNPPKGERETGA